MCVSQSSYPQLQVKHRHLLPTESPPISFALEEADQSSGGRRGKEIKGQNEEDKQ
eukprot:SAG11_NODE_1505_length_4782_cov_2.698270_2_plen_55_part_00